MGIIRPSAPQPIVVAIQGGAALGAFAWGALDALLEYQNIRIIGASGTSSGALTASFLMEGLIKGDNRMAQRRMAECWWGLSLFQSTQQPLWFTMTDSEQQLCATIPGMDIFASVVRGIFRQAGEISTNRQQPLFRSSPILNFLKAMEGRDQGLDFDALQKAKDHFLFVNATHVPQDTNHWKAELKNERIFTGPEITPEMLAASGSLAELMPPVIINNEALRDGGYFSNPHLPALEKLCDEHNARLVVVRTRPTNSFPYDGQIPSSDNQRRAFFNSILDRDLQSLRQRRPDLKISVIEPKNPESNTVHIMKPELCFHMDDLKRRHRHGYERAQEIISVGKQPFVKGHSLPNKAHQELAVSAL